MTISKHKPTHASLAIIALAMAASIMTGCRGERTDKPPRQFFPDMDDSPKFKPQTQTGFFADGRAMRPTVAGSVAFGRTTSPTDPTRGAFLHDDEAFNLGTDANGNFIERIPASVTVDAALLARGQERFNIYCAACHNYDGYGKGMVGQQWAYALPSFHDAKYQPGAKEEFKDPATNQTAMRTAKTGLDGYIFHTIRNGVENGAKMPPYGHALKPADAWAVVAYFRALQRSENGTIADVPAGNERARVQSALDQARAKWERDEAERKRLEKEEADKAAAKKNAPPAPTAPTPTTPAAPAQEKKP